MQICEDRPITVERKAWGTEIDCMKNDFVFLEAFIGAEKKKKEAAFVVLGPGLHSV